MRIVHIINGLDNGGAEAALVRLVSQRSTDIHHVIAMSPPGWHSKTLASRGIEVHHLGWGSFAPTFFWALAILRLLRQLKPDVVQSWMYRSNVIGGLACKVVGVPVAWGIHCSSCDTHFPFASRAMIRLSGAIASLIPDAIVNCSQRSATAHEAIGYPRSRTRLVCNGLDTEEFAPDPAARLAIRTALGVNEKTFLIGLVGRWHPQKDHPNLIEALRVFDTRWDGEWRCLLVGPGVGPDNATLQRLLAAAGVAEKFLLSEARADIPAVMTALDLHVLPSAYGESLPNVVAESMACETPCVVTDVGDAGYLVGDFGWIVRPWSPESLAEAIEAAVREARSGDARWMTRKAAARRRIVDNFSTERMYAGYHEVWATCLAGKRDLVIA